MKCSCSEMCDNELLIFNHDEISVRFKVTDTFLAMCKIAREIGDGRVERAIVLDEEMKEILIANLTGKGRKVR